MPGPSQVLVDFQFLDLARQRIAPPADQAGRFLAAVLGLVQGALDQDAFNGGLGNAEQVAVAAEEAKERAEQSIKVTLALVGLSVLLIALSLRRRNR